MKGKVEVFAIAADGSERLVLSEPNLVVNGAGQSIVDMLCVPSSTLGISPRVMDTSNWRWGAISFGPAASSFQENAYFYPKDQVYINPGDCGAASADITSFINQQGVPDPIAIRRNIRVLWLSSTIGDAFGVNGATPSSYTPPFRLPSYPSPLDTKLEDASTAYSIVSGDGTQSYGQFENRIEFNAGDSSSYYQGAFAPKVTGYTTFLSGLLVSSYEGDWQTDRYLHVIDRTGPADELPNGLYHKATYGGYNSVSGMDFRGYVSACYDDPTQICNAVCLVSGSVPADLTGATSQVTIPKASVYTCILEPDVWAMNLYGGLHQIGLWNVDCKKSLENYEAPFLWPHLGSGNNQNEYRDSAGVTKLEYKLFAKKTFTQNMCAIMDSTANAGFLNPQELKIVWTMDFRSDHD